MGATSRNKGARGELLVRDLYRSNGFDCRRNFGSGSQGLGDIVGDLPDVPEIKNTERITFWPWVEQATTNIRPPYGLNDWSLFITGNRRPLVVALPAERYMQLLVDQRSLQQALLAEGVRDV